MDSAGVESMDVISGSVLYVLVLRVVVTFPKYTATDLFSDKGAVLTISSGHVV